MTESGKISRSPAIFRFTVGFLDTAEVIRTPPLTLSTRHKYSRQIHRTSATCLSACARARIPSACQKFETTRGWPLNMPQVIDRRARSNDSDIRTTIALQHGNNNTTCNPGLRLNQLSHEIQKYALDGGLGDFK